jgi:ComF family protein
VRPIAGPACSICGTPLLSEAGTCTRCRDRSYHFESARPVFEYAGAVRELLYLYKFEGRRRLAAVFAQWIAEALASCWPGVALVPVPGRAQPLRRRGWEHVAEIARHLERRHGARVLCCLARLPGGQQKLLDFAARAANVRGRIRFRDLGSPLPAEVVLLDDVLTTGATADECARVLRSAGARRVHLVTLAID